jgi:glycosyltransferase involved in cell wall biosynthesis
MTSNTTNPKVSVVMPVYNAEKFLRESLDSILRQTFEDFEVIIINDGSTDDSKSIINEYQKRDDRIIVHHQKNHGVVYTANRAIQMAKGEYIARMDADDVSFPDRFLQEVEILDRHPKTVLVCSSFEVFDSNGEFRYRDLVPPNTEDIKRALYLRNPIANGSTMVRKKALEEAGLFDEVFAEDFHMWMKLINKGDFEGTGTVLYRWRMNPNGLTLSNNSLSIHQGKNYINNLWQEGVPRNVTRKEIAKLIANYKKVHKAKGMEFSNIILTDLTQLAAKLFLKGQYLNGIRQLLAVAFVNTAGTKAALQRLHFISTGHYNKLRKRIPFGRGTYDSTI